MITKPLALIGCLLIPALAMAQTSINYTFEDGAKHGSGTSMKVPPQVLTEGGNKFLRITGSTGDCQSLPSTRCSDGGNRSTVRFTSSFGSMPVITSSNMRQTYSADIRFHNSSGRNGSVLELFQGAPGGESGGYGSRNGTGPVVRFWRENGHEVGVSALYANETQKSHVNLPARPGEWHNYKVVAVWSHDPSIGKIEIYQDGKLKMRVTGRDVNLGPSSNRIPEMKMGLYGDNARGIVDVDNIQVHPTGGEPPSGGGPPPSSPPSPSPVTGPVPVPGGPESPAPDGRPPPPGSPPPPSPTPSPPPPVVVQLPPPPPVPKPPAPPSVKAPQIPTSTGIGV